MRLNINHLKVDKVEKASGIYSGFNLHFGRASTSCANEGFGLISGLSNQVEDGIYGVAGSRMKEAEAYGGQKR
ncbi:MAG: hypothetical protein H7X86_06415 [Gorillibacterium sp.]|nr:hypothetical protein [Gorillibacterium sp.]